MSPIEHDICSAFETWVEAGPRMVMSDRRLIMPNSSDCYNASGPDEIILTCLTTNLDCPKDVECEDAADTLFKKTLYRSAHTWTEYDYFEVFNICLGTIKKRTSFYSKESKQSQSYSIEKNGIVTKLTFDADSRHVKVVAGYSK